MSSPTRASLMAPPPLAKARAMANGPLATGASGSDAAKRKRDRRTAWYDTIHADCENTL